VLKLCVIDTCVCDSIAIGDVSTFDALLRTPHAAAALTSRDALGLVPADLSRSAQMRTHLRRVAARDATHVDWLAAHVEPLAPADDDVRILVTLCAMLL
jgi:hypothetical protein